jgi:hypothetical protein
MSNKSLKIAQKFAPVLCCELSKNRRKRIYDCFSAIDFHPDKKPCEMQDRIAVFNSMFPNLDENKETIESTLIPSIYYSFIESKTHYFLLYTVYHALDQKSPFGHEHDMEHIQVIVRKSEETVEYVTTIAHHAFFYYVNEDNPVRPHPPYLNTSENGYIVLYNNTHPVVYIQPGDGSIYSVFNEEIGHGIFGIGGVYKGGFKLNWSKKWHENYKTFDFENKDGNNIIGIVASIADEDNPTDPYNLKNEINLINYNLESVEETIWQWFKNREKNDCMCREPSEGIDWKPGLFKTVKEWKPTKFTILHENESRKDYFDRVFKIKKFIHPSGVCGTRDAGKDRIRTAGGSWPFEYKNRVTGRRFSYMVNETFFKDVPAINLDIFFDPAAAYKIMVTAQEPISTEYINYPHYYS